MCTGDKMLKNKVKATGHHKDNSLYPPPQHIAACVPARGWRNPSVKEVSGFTGHQEKKLFFWARSAPGHHITCVSHFLSKQYIDCRSFCTSLWQNVSVWCNYFFHSFFFYLFLLKVTGSAFWVFLRSQEIVSLGQVLIFKRIFHLKIRHYVTCKLLMKSLELRCLSPACGTNIM